VNARHKAGHDDPLLILISCVMAGLVPAIHALSGIQLIGQHGAFFRTLLKAGQLQSPDQLLRTVNVGGCMLNFIDIPISDPF
jgi:hypothetical protein